jgi:hypothetical protein
MQLCAPKLSIYPAWPPSSVRSPAATPDKKSGEEPFPPLSVSNCMQPSGEWFHRPCAERSSAVAPTCAAPVLTCVAPAVVNMFAVAATFAAPAVVNMSAVAATFAVLAEPCASAPASPAEIPAAARHGRPVVASR